MRLRRRRGGRLPSPQVRPERLRELGLPRICGWPRGLILVRHRLQVRRGVPPVKRHTLDLGLHAAPGSRYSARLRRRSSVVERILGKAEVGSSILPGGTTFPQAFQWLGETPPLPHLPKKPPVST